MFCFGHKSSYKQWGEAYSGGTGYGYGLGRRIMGDTRRRSTAGAESSPDAVRSDRNGGPQNPDGTGVGKMERGMQKPPPFPVGYSQGELVILAWKRRTDTRKAGYHPWVRCSCGWEGFVDRHNFKKRASTRCNSCAKQATARWIKRYWKYADVVPDDAHRTRLLNRLSSAIGRCHGGTDKNGAYKIRGITVCQEWRDDRAEFLRYVITVPGWDVPEYDMDRIDNDKGYAPGNIRFVSRRDNCNNKRTISGMQARIDALEAELASLRPS